VEWVDGLALVKGHANVLRAIGIAPTRDASCRCLPLRDDAPCPLDTRLLTTIVVSI
jgi:hypothetical protein